MRYEFGGLIFGGVYTWRGLFSELYGIMLFYKVKKFLASSVQIVWSKKHDGELSDNKIETKLKEITILNPFSSIPPTPTQPDLTLSSLFRAVNKYLDALTDQGRFPFVRTEQPAHSHLNKNFTLNQN